MKDVIVVGAGLFGSVIAAELRSQGREVLVIDSQRQHAGSKPAACLMKPSWFSSLTPAVYEPSLALLDRLYGVQDIVFKVGPGHATVHWCDPRKILRQGFVRGHVEQLLRLPDHWEVVLREGHVLQARMVVVAAGIWSAELADVRGLKGQAGVAFLWPEGLAVQPFIRPWAPYRQLVGFDRGDGFWVGDGSAIKPENWSVARENLCYSRCVGAVGRTGKGDRVQALFGVRPYVKEKPCYLHEHAPGLWVATGGAKNGTIAAGWCAHELSRRTS